MPPAPRCQAIGSDPGALQCGLRVAPPGHGPVLGADYATPGRFCTERRCRDPGSGILSERTRTSARPSQVVVLAAPGSDTARAGRLQLPCAGGWRIGFVVFALQISDPMSPSVALMPRFHDPVSPLWLSCCSSPPLSPPSEHRARCGPWSPGLWPSGRSSPTHEPLAPRREHVDAPWI